MQALVTDEARALSGAIDGGIGKIREAFAQLAGKSGDADLVTQVADQIRPIVQAAREWAHREGSRGIERELALIAPDFKTSLDRTPEPITQDVEQYVANAAQWAVDRARAAEDVGATLAASTDRAEVVIEAETVNEYERARARAMSTLMTVPDDPANGFVLAHSLSEFDRQARALKTAAAVLGCRWSAVNDSRTCSQCHSVDGQMRLVGFGSFSQPGPSAHPRCRCITHLWAVGWPWEEEAMRSHNVTADTVTHFTPLEARAFAIDEQSRTIRGVVLSDETLDAHGTIVRASGWDLERFKSNPILLWDHPERKLEGSEPDDILGTVENVHVEGTALIGDLQFVPEGVNEEADKVFRLMAARALKGVSVYFRPKQYHFEQVEKREIVVVDKQELIEVSVTPIPSNPNTLARSLRALMAASDAPAASQSTPVAQAADSTRATAQERTIMKSALIVALGLKADADESEVLGAVASMRDAQRSYLGVAGKESLPEALGVVEAWKRSHEALPGVQAELADMRTRALKADVDSIFTAAAGKVTPAMEQSLRARSYDKPEDVAWLRAFVETMPTVQALGAKVDAPASPASVLTDEERRAARSLNLTEDQYAAHKAVVAARDRQEAAQ